MYMHLHSYMYDVHSYTLSADADRSGGAEGIMAGVTHKPGAVTGITTVGKSSRYSALSGTGTAIGTSTLYDDTYVVARRSRGPSCTCVWRSRKPTILRKSHVTRDVSDSTHMRYGQHTSRRVAHQYVLASRNTGFGPSTIMVRGV